MATGIPVQLSAWDQLPVWYNLVFLVLLVPVTMLGVRIGIGDRRGQRGTVYFVGRVIITLTLLLILASLFESISSLILKTDNQAMTS